MSASPLPAPPPRPHWTTIELAGHVCEIHAPPEPAAGRALVYLHGVRERWLQDMAALRDLVEAARLPVIAPRAGRSWWIDRIVPAFDPAITPERFVVEHVVAEIARRFAVRPPGIAVVGTSMGGQGALRLAYRHPQVFPVAAAIAPAIDFHLAMREIDDRADGRYYDTLWEIYGDVERARQDTAILHVHPLNWPRQQFFASDPADIHWHDGPARLHSKLVALGIPHTARLEPRVPADTDAHGPAYYDLVAADVMQFITTALDSESRRLPT
jgi:pimeloyl-ACP methyl ester carboxylesterase